MTPDRHLRRKWTFRAHGRQVVLVKRPIEKPEHVWMKALLWALYLPDYSDLTIEVSVGDRYKPDVVALDDGGTPRFWGEAGQVGQAKIRALAKRYPTTHFAIARWATSLEPLARLVGAALEGLSRRAPFDLIHFPSDSAERFIGARGDLSVGWDGVTRLRLGGG